MGAVKGVGVAFLKSLPPTATYQAKGAGEVPPDVGGREARVHGIHPDVGIKSQRERAFDPTANASHWSEGCLEAGNLGDRSKVLLLCIL